MAISQTWIQGTSGDIPSYPARDDRRVIAALWDEGVLQGGVITANSTNRELTLATGTVVVIDGDHSADQGSYLVAVHTAAATVTIDAAPGSGSRIDLLGLRVRDLDEGGDAGNDVIFDKVTGTSGASPSAPATPASFLVLWRVQIAAGVVALLPAHLTDARVYSGPKAPLGTVRMHYGPTSTIPVGWEELTGQAWSSGAGHDALAARLGLTLPTTAPDSRGKTPRGVAASGTGSTVGGTFGADAVTLAADQIPTHQHTIDHDHVAGTTGGQSADHAHLTGGETGHTHGPGTGTVFITQTSGDAGPHTIDISSLGGGNTVHGPSATGAGSGHTHGYTGGVNQGHTHTFDPITHSGSSGTGTGLGGTAVSTIQAGIALRLIIRVKA